MGTNIRPAAAIALLMFGVLGLLVVLSPFDRRLHANQEARAEAAAENVYRYAKAGRYSEIKGRPIAVGELKRLEEAIGPVESSGPYDSSPGDGDKPATVMLHVKRHGKEFISTMLMDYEYLLSISEQPIEEWSARSRL